MEGHQEEKVVDTQNEEVMDTVTEQEYAAEGQIVYKEKVFLGFVGALLGSILGAVCIVLIGQFGYVASICGVVMGICALKGYRILSGGMSIKGIIITAILMIIMVYLSNMVSWGIAVAEVFEVDMLTGTLAIPTLISEGAIEAADFYKELGMLYLFTALGAVPTIRDQFK